MSFCLIFPYNVLSVDQPTGTGDHENYYDVNFNAYELNGRTYKNCRKKAVHVRSVEEQISWWNIRDHLILFAWKSNYFLNAQTIEIENEPAINVTNRWEWLQNVISWILSVHCFNQLQPTNVCIDMEVSYYIECYEEHKLSKRSEVSPLWCHSEKVLLLSNREETNVPMLISSNGEGFFIACVWLIVKGKSETDFTFVYEEGTQADGSCGFILQNEIWIAGGWGNNGANNRQEVVSLS